MKLAFIGLGVMGFPMAGHLENRGHDVCVYNRTQEKASNWIGKYHGKCATSPARATIDAEIVFVCVGNDEDVRSVIYGDDGILSSIKPESILVDHTTASANLAEEIFLKTQERNVGFLDAPVSGGKTGAENGKLTIMVGGSEVHFEKAKGVMENYAKKLLLVGPNGHGQLTKMVNQICVANVIQGLAEGIQFATNAGIDTKKVMEVISEGAAQSWQMDNRSKSMIEGKFNFGFACDWMHKDLQICLNEGKRNGSKLPVTQILDQAYEKLINQGEGRSDTSALIKLLGIH